MTLNDLRNLTGLNRPSHTFSSGTYTPNMRDGGKVSSTGSIYDLPSPSPDEARRVLNIFQQRKRNVLGYLDSQGFANDGYGNPISANANTAINFWLANGQNPEFYQLTRKVRNTELRELIEGLSYVASLPGSNF